MSKIITVLLLYPTDANTIKNLSNLTLQIVVLVTDNDREINFLLCDATACAKMIRWGRE